LLKLFEIHEEVGMKAAPKLKRFYAALMDGVFIMALGFIPVVGVILAAFYTLLRDGLPIVGLKERSIGKSVIGLKVVVFEGGQEAKSWMDSVKRNFLWLIPLMGLVEAFFVLFDKDSRRIGDRIAGTLVVEG
jgi:uncharacterized RDD family membrane protein YckC